MKADGNLTIGAGGDDIWDADDAFRFVYKQLNGNGAIIAISVLPSAIIPVQ